jgi:hypothetical protein
MGFARPFNIPQRALLTAKFQPANFERAAQKGAH